MRKPGIDSSLSSVPPVWPRARPDIIGTTTPQAAASGARISDVLSPTPPVLCLSTFSPGRCGQVDLDAGMDHRLGQVGGLLGGHPAQDDGHQQGRDLVLGPAPVGDRRGRTPGSRRGTARRRPALRAMTSTARMGGVSIVTARRTPRRRLPPVRRTSSSAADVRRRRPRWHAPAAILGADAAAGRARDRLVGACGVSAQAHRVAGHRRSHRPSRRRLHRRGRRPARRGGGHPRRPARSTSARTPSALARRGPSTRVIDAGGRAVLPGLHDAHGHVLGLGAQLQELDLRGTTSLDEVDREGRRARAATRARTSGSSAAAGIRTTGRTRPGRRATALDAAAPDQPV